ncbi:TetR family transcriptional regulator [Blastococcus sp. TBT05-19]|nr:TetR family transcriptional regulator [Blastococcus sp. TBT05-19]
MRSAAEVAARSGVAEVSIRALARSLGVSHAAHRHHFASRTGLLTAVAAEGHRLLAAELEAAAPAGFLEVGVAYVRFARDHPGHFAVMFTPDALDLADPELAAARARTFGVLQGGVDVLASTGRVDDARAAVVAAWSLVHGLAGLAASGNLAAAGLAPDGDGDALLDLARRTAGMLYGSPGGGPDGA